MESLPARVHPPNTNGNHAPAPPVSSGGAVVSAHRRAPTLFPPEIERRSLPLFLYLLGRGQVGGVSLLRWLWIGGGVMALSAPALLAGGLWLSMAILLLLSAISLLHRWQARRFFVRFTEEPHDPPDAAPLPASEKIPLHVTGLLEVGGRLRPFTGLPGFYRTFATREHALLCQCRERRVLGIGMWPEGEVGLWYGFVKPERVRSVRYGRLHLGQAALPALAIDYVPEPSPALRKRRGVEALYLAGADEASILRILADLAVDSRDALVERPSQTKALA